MKNGKCIDIVERELHFKEIEKTKGITLVALIITIIILLILAGITIAQLAESGLFEKVQLAKEKQENAQKIENATLGDYENKIGQYVDGNYRENNSDSTSKRTVLFDGTTDLNGPIINAGTTDGSSERTFTDNVNNYDILLIYAEVMNDNRFFPPTIVDKLDFNKSAKYYIGGVSSTVGNATGDIKIDTENNKIIYEAKGHSTHQILRVIGIKI